jgi:molybdate transport system permease protein
VRRVAPAAALAAAATVFLAIPLMALLVETPWSALPGLLTDPAAVTALRLSLVVSVAAALLAGVFGVALGWILARHRFPGRSALRLLALVPLVLPPVVGGVALLLAFGRRGVLGRWLDAWFGVQLPFTTAGAVLAAAFVALPFVVLTAEAAFADSDRGLEEAARTLGASPAQVARRVTLPLAAPALRAGLALAWARALGEFGATITFAGRVPGRTATLPLEVYLQIEAGRPEAAVALSVVLLAVSVAVLALLRGRWLR